MPVFIGMLMLFGITAKNSILLVEFAIEDERAGQTRWQALRNACRERARPIIMTTVAMIAGMLPTAIGLGQGSEFRKPMAIAVIGGLISSTVLSLVLVPVVYLFIDGFEHWLTPWARAVDYQAEPRGRCADTGRGGDVGDGGGVSTTDSGATTPSSIRLLWDL